MSLFFFVANTMATNVENIQLSLSPNITNKGSMIIDWSGYDCKDKIFKVYRSHDNKTFETISIDHTQVERINCLQVYPHESLENQLKDWMSKYGSGIINVSSVTIEKFNEKPNDYLPNYDVIFFGTYDGNNIKDLSETAVQPLKDYIKSGKGVIFGHDTFWVSEKDPNAPTHKYFNKFADDVGIKVYQYAGTHLGVNVTIAKTGLLTSYPHNLETGKTFTVPATHISTQEVTDINNVYFFLHTDEFEKKPNRSFYLTTRNNVAFIQTGHSGGNATDDEMMIIANLIFNCYQLVVSNGIMHDYGAIDTSKPTKPTILGKFDEFAVLSEDEGTKYYYKVESYSKENTLSDSYIGNSSIIDSVLTTGIAKYCYMIDKDKDTEINNINNEENDNLICSNNRIIKSSAKNGYLHVCAVDSAGNISPTSTIKIQYPKITCENRRNSLYKVIQYLSMSILILMFHK